MTRHLLTILLLCTLTLLLGFMGWFTIRVLQIERETGERLRQETYERKLNLTIWQLESTALAIYNNSIAEIKLDSAKRTYVNNRYIIDNVNITEVIGTSKSTTSKGATEIDKKNQILQAMSHSARLNLKVDSEKPPPNLEWSSEWSTKKKTQDYNTRANNVIEQKRASQNILSNSVPIEQSSEGADQLSASLINREDEFNGELFQAFWINDELYLLRNLEAQNQIEAILLNDQVVAEKLKAEQPNLTLTPQTHIYTRIENNRLSIIPSSEIPYAENTLATLPYTISLPEVALPNTKSIWVRNLIITWSALLLSIALSAFFILSLWKLSKRRSDFVAAVTHELRTPLTSFQLYTEMLHDDLVPDPSKRRNYIKTLNTEAKRLSHLVENVLSYSRLERGKTHKSEIALSSLLPPIFSRLEERVARTQARLETAICLPKGLTIITDPTAVEQIMFNLIDNACKYALEENPTQIINLEVTCNNGNLIFSLTDQGPGVPKRELKKLFTPFHKSVTTAAQTSKPGVGLGLFIAKRQAKMLGGDLTVSNPKAGGACFILTLRQNIS